jgi:hypothetical protein
MKFSSLNSTGNADSTDWSIIYITAKGTSLAIRNSIFVKILMK